jgi:hypothetical protein
MSYPPEAPGPSQQGPYGPPNQYPGGYPYRQPQRQTDARATVGLVLALTSWFVCPLVFAVAALVVAGQSNRAIEASAGQLEGQSLNTVSKWLAWANIAFYGLLAIAVLALVVWVVANQDSLPDLSDPSLQF